MVVSNTTLFQVSSWSNSLEEMRCPPHELASPNFHLPFSAWLYVPWDLPGRQFLLVSSNQVQLCLFFTPYLCSCVTSLCSSARPSFSYYPTSPSNVPDLSSSCPSTPSMGSLASSSCFSASFP